MFEAAQEGARVPHCGRVRLFSTAFRVEVHGNSDNARRRHSPRREFILTLSVRFTSRPVC